MTTAPNLCLECKSRDIVVDFGAGDVICRGCGVILSDRIIDESAEWMNYAESSKISGNRCSGAINSVADVVSILKGGNKTELEHLNSLQRKVDRKSGLSKSGNHHSRIEEIATSLSLSGHIAEMASQLLKQLEQSPLFRRRSGSAGEAICAALIYLACRRENVARSFAEIAPVVNIEKREVAKAYKYIGRHLDLSNVTSGEIRGEHLVPRICSALGISPYLSQVAKYTASRCFELSLTDGMKPSAVAAISIWLIVNCCLSSDIRIFEGDDSHDMLTPKRIAEACSISVQLLEKQYKKIYEYQPHLIPQDFSHRTLCKAKSYENVLSM